MPFREKKTLIRSFCDRISVFLFLLDFSFDLKIQLLESIHSLLFGLPETSPLCLKERLGDAAKRPGIHTLHPVLHLGIQGIGGRELLIHPVLHDIARCIPLETDGNAIRKICRAFVAMLHKAFDEFWIHSLRAEDALRQCVP